MLSRRTSLVRLPMIASITALGLVSVLVCPSPVGAETASHRPGASLARAGTSETKARKPTADTQKTTMNGRPADRMASATQLTSPARLSTLTQVGKIVAPYTYNTLRHHYAFSGTAVDTSVWGVYNTNGSWSKDRDARRPELVTVSNNTLHVTATGPKGSGLCLCNKSVKPTTPYGRYEIRARASANTDHGFAMLLWPNAENWPTGGEIDIAEYNSARTKLWTTVHYSATNKRYITGTPGDYTQWHTYGVEWTPSAITYYVDGVVVMTVTDPAAIPRQAMHLALQAGKNEGVKSPSDTSTTLDVAWINEYS